LGICELKLARAGGSVECSTDVRPHSKGQAKVRGGKDRKACTGQIREAELERAIPKPPWTREYWRVVGDVSLHFHSADIDMCAKQTR